MEEKTKLVKMSEISLSLDTYDDIFSDFDPRPYAERALSDDFLIEAKKAAKDKAEGSIELNFLIPKQKRNPYDESLIKKRLHEHFRKHHLELYHEKKKIIHAGARFIVSGIVLMFLATYILFKYQEQSLFLAFMTILLEPAGWFLFWEGLNQAIFTSKTKSPDLEFYRKMSSCHINFMTY